MLVRLYVQHFVVFSLYTSNSKDRWSDSAVTSEDDYIKAIDRLQSIYTVQRDDEINLALIRLVKSFVANSFFF